MKTLHSKFSDDENNGADWSSLRGEDEDDIPLAQRIPGALQAQKSIRSRNRAYSTKVKPEVEARTKQSSFEVTELTRKLVKLNDRSFTQPTNGTGTYWSAHNSLYSNSTSPPPLLPIPFTPLNVSSESRNRPRNKSFSQQATPDINFIPNATLLSRSTTQSAPKASSRTTQSSVSEPFPTESSTTRPTINPPSRSQTDPPVRSRSKSFSSLSKNTEAFPRSIDQTRLPPLPLPNLRPINTTQLQVPLQSSSNAVQQRIFIDTMQRFNTVQIHAQTSAYEIITKIATQGELGSGDVTDASKDWMLWEIAQDFGLGMI
ncbi:hypothetical protein Clacol_009839 [Clathrus columnatus]|uniref:Uncharacterized protein n=1 Tax=Clathrus columnatus TaxID=1419009 RepID=A0AAV5AT91_9AGAM|nr:hypothetical protein Clacol_009839 [Clathrus columnatus]